MSNVLSYTPMSGNSAIQISGATLEVGGTVTFNNIPLTIVTVSGDTAILTGMFNPAPVANVDTVTVAGAAPVGPSVVEKKFVQQNDGALGGSLTDLRATSIEVAAGGNIDMGGNQIHNVAEGTAQDDVVVVSQLSAAVSGITVDIDMVATDLTAEVDRATSAEASLASGLSTEIAAREAAVSNEASLRASAVASLATVASTADASLASDLSTEIANREAAVSNEASLRVAGDASVLAAAEGYTDQKITDLIGGAPGLLDTLGELAAAIGNDESFSVTVANNIATAKSEIAAAVSTEVVRATSAEGSLGSALSSEASRAIAAEGSLNSALASEISRAQSAEVSAYQAAADYAEQLVDNEASLRVDGDASVALAMSTADASLAVQISTEIVDRAAAVSNEASLRVAADASLTTRLST